ncbi:cyclin-like protein, partial [Dimargaris cristalligena]
ELERRTMPSVANMGQQPEIRWEYRPALIDYVTSLHAQLKLCQDTLYLTVNLMDRYLSTRIVHVHMLQLLVVACTWVASKLEEEKHHIPRLDDLVYACNSAYDKLEVKRMEIEILVTLKYVLRHPNPELFIHRTALTQDEAPLTINVARYFAELTLFEADFLSYLPSTVAAAALSLARSLLGAQRTTDTDAQATACENQLRLRLSHVPPTLHAKYARSRFSEASIIV